MLTGSAVGIVDFGSEPFDTFDNEHTTNSVRLRSFPPFIPITDGRESCQKDGFVKTLISLE